MFLEKNFFVYFAGFAARNIAPNSSYIQVGSSWRLFGNKSATLFETSKQSSLADGVFLEDFIALHLRTTDIFL